MGPFVRNLIFHLHPSTNTLAWRGNVNALLHYGRQFDGRRVVAVATGAGCEAVEDVYAAFPRGWVTRWLVMPNSPAGRDGATLLRRLEAVADPDPRQIVFQCHTKGASVPRPEDCSARWRDTMYRACLADPAAVDAALVGHAVAGAYRMRLAPGFPAAYGCPWYFAGSFWWARHDRLFGGDRWRGLDFGLCHIAELLPGLLFDHADSVCLFGDDWAGGDVRRPETFGPYLDF